MYVTYAPKTVLSAKSAWLEAVPSNLDTIFQDGSTNKMTD